MMFERDLRSLFGEPKQLGLIPGGGLTNARGIIKGRDPTVTDVGRLVFAALEDSGSVCSNALRFDLELLMDVGTSHCIAIRGVSRV